MPVKSIIIMFRRKFDGLPLYVICSLCIFEKMGLTEQIPEIAWCPFSMGLLLSQTGAVGRLRQCPRRQTPEILWPQAKPPWGAFRTPFAGFPTLLMLLLQHESKKFILLNITLKFNVQNTLFLWFPIRLWTSTLEWPHVWCCSMKLLVEIYCMW